MTSRIRKALLVALGATALVSSADAQAPDGITVYTRIANWQIARPNWEAYTEDLKKNTLPVLEKLLADGVITEYRSRLGHHPHAGWLHALHVVQQPHDRRPRESAGRDPRGRQEAACGGTASGRH